MTELTSAGELSRYRSLVFIFLGGPVIWSLHFLAVYGVVEAACRVGLLRFNVLWMSGTSFIVVVLTLIAAAVTLYVGLLGYRRWQRREDDEHEQRWRGENESDFLTLVGVLFSGFFAVAILLTGIPSLFLNPCLGV